jgi:hypothetical protein
MGEDDITVKVDFVWTHEFEFYKGSEGGLRTGVTQNVLWPYYNTTVITYEGAGRTGGNAIKVAAGEKQVGLVSSQPINLEGVYALSFWAKTSGAVPVEFACFGSNIGEGLTYQNLVMYGNVTYQGDTFTINSTDWKHYMIPVPVQKPGAVADRFILKTNGSGNDLYLDDIEFLIDEEAIECTSIDIPLTYNREFMYPGPTSAESIFNTMQYTAEYTFDTDVTTTLKNMIAIPALALTFRFSDWGGLDYAVDGAASISDGQITTASLGGAFNLYLKIGETISTAMACTTLSSNKVIIEDFEECVTGNFGSNNTLGYREWGTWTGVNNTGNLFISGLSGRIYNSNNGKSGRHFASSIDISSCTNISLKVKSLVALQDGDSYTLELRNGSEGEGTWYSSNFTIDVANMVETKILAISSFVGLDTSAITGWRVGIVGTPTARDIVVDDIEAE